MLQLKPYKNSTLRLIALGGNFVVWLAVACWLLSGCASLTKQQPLPTPQAFPALCPILPPLQNADDIEPAYLRVVRLYADCACRVCALRTDCACKKAPQ